MMDYPLQRLRRDHTLLFNALLVAWGACLLTAAAPLAIPLPFTPVPITFQIHLVILLGIMMGPKRSMAAVLAWLAEGAFGLPVFANGAGGILAFFGPTGGFLLSYPLIACLGGLIAYGRPTGLRLGLAFLCGSLAVYPIGLFHLSQFIGWDRAFQLGFFPFLPGSVLKSLFLAIVWKKAAPRFTPRDA